MVIANPRELDEICVEFIYERTSKIEKKLHIKNERKTIFLDGEAINSLYDSELKEFTKAVRSEWKIENNLH